MKFNQKTLKGLLTVFSLLLVLLLILLRGGREPEPGVLVAEDTAYRLYADGNLFYLRLLDASGRTAREEGPMDREPILWEEEPGLWSVTHGAGPDWLLMDFSQPLAETATTPFQSAAFTEDGKALEVTYLSGEDFREVTETIPLPELEG